MTQPAMQHLTADELDALVGGLSSPRALSHVATCPLCDEMVALDRRVVALLGGLPAIEPAAGFADRVMARVTIADGVIKVVTAPTRTPREVAAKRRILGLSLVGGTAVAAGFAWAVTHPASATGWSGAAVGGVGESLWLSVQALAANTAEQPWFGTVREALTTPLRALPYVVGGAGLYAIGLTGLSRLLAEPATDAGW